LSGDVDHVVESDGEGDGSSVAVYVTADYEANPSSGTGDGGVGSRRPFGATVIDEASKTTESIRSDGGDGAVQTPLLMGTVDVSVRDDDGDEKEHHEWTKVEAERGEQIGTAPQGSPGQSLGLAAVIQAAKEKMRKSWD
jgi:hypothetical protein